MQSLRKVRSMSKLEPCPFCPDGGYIEVQSYREGKSRISPYRASVMCCYCNTERYAYGSTEETAIENAKKTWNTRFQRKSHLVLTTEYNRHGGELWYIGCSECLQFITNSSEYGDDYVFGYCPQCGCEIDGSYIEDYAYGEIVWKSGDGDLGDLGDSDNWRERRKEGEDA